MDTCPVDRDGYLSPGKKPSARHFTGIEISTPVDSEPVVEGCVTEMKETEPPFSPRSTKKHKSSAPVSPDDFVEDRIKVLKKSIGGPKGVSNKWTEMLRGKLDQVTVKDKFAGDRTFKTNQ